MEEACCGCSKRVNNPTVDEAGLNLEDWKQAKTDPTWLCGIVDFRTPEEYYQKHIVGATNIPWKDFRDRGKNRQIII